MLSASVTNAWRSRLLHAPAEGRGFAFAGLDRDGGLAGVGGERVAGRVARAAVADLGQQLCGGDHAAGPLNSEQEDLAVGVLADARRDLRARARLICSLSSLIVATKRQHQLAAGGQLKLADAALGSAPELGEQLRGLLAAGVALAGEKRGQARLAQPARVGRARVALKERERDLAVQIAEQAERSGPEPLELGP